jgi:hypothetical protein
LYLRAGKIENALISSLRSLDYARENGYPELTATAAQALHAMYSKKGDYKKALGYYELYVQMRDSVYNESNKKSIIRSQLKYEYEKQAAADSVAHAKETEVKNAELAQHQAEIKAKKNQAYALFGGLALVIVFAGFMYNRFKITRKQKVIIEKQKGIVEAQKQLVEEKQKEILDSIRYAKRIQKAHLPSEKYMVRTISRIQKK